MTRAHESNLVRKRREKQGMLLVELASKAKRSAALISNIERGYVPKRVTMEAIAAALDTTAPMLWPDEFEALEEFA